MKNKQLTFTDRRIIKEAQNQLIKALEYTNPVLTEQVLNFLMGQDVLHNDLTEARKYSTWITDLIDDNVAYILKYLMRIKYGKHKDLYIYSLRTRANRLKTQIKRKEYESA